MRKRLPSFRDLFLVALLLGALAMMLVSVGHGLAQAPPVLTPTYVWPYANQPEGQVDVSSLNVRTGPHVSYTAVAYLMDGERVVLVGRNRLATWAQIELYNGYRGWVSARYLHTPIDLGALPIVDVDLWAMTAFVTNDPVPVFAGPGMIYGVNVIAQPGETLTFDGRTDNASWVHAVLPDGRSGWVAAGGTFIALASINNLPIISPFLDAAPAHVSPYYLAYAGPGMGYETIDRILVGQTLAIEGRTADNLWVLVRLPDGRAGWIATEILRLPVPVTHIPVISGNAPPLVVGWQGSPATAAASPSPATPAATETATSTPSDTPEVTVTATPEAPAESTPTPEATAGGGNKLPQLPTGTPEGDTSATPGDPTAATMTPSPTVEPSATTDNSPTPQPSPTSTATSTPAPLLVYMYAAPADDAEPIQTVVPGQSVMLLGRTADSAWIKIRLDDGVEGWIHADAVQVQPDVSVLPVVTP